MHLTIRLFVQRHENRTYTVSVPIFAGLAAYGPTLEECKKEVAEALAKRLADVDHDLLHVYAFKPNQSLEKVAVELRPTDQNSRRRRNTVKLSVSLLLSPEEDGQILISAPRLRQPPLTFYVARREELAEVAQLELAQYFHEEPVEAILALQASRYETLDTLEVEFRPKKATDKEDEQEEEKFWALKASGVNLTAQAAEGQLRRAFRRDQLVEQVLGALAGDRRPSLLLVGPSSAGKTAVAHEVARRIRKKECAEALHDRQIWALTADSLIAGCSYIGQWQDKLNDLVREVRKKRHILFVEDVAALAEAGRWSKGDENMAEFLKPHLLSGDVVLIGETSPERLRRLEQLAPGFAAQFRTIEISPTSETDTLSILAALARELERAEDIRIEPSAIEAAVELTTRFLPYRAQPGKAVALVEQMAGDAGRARTAIGTRTTLTRREVIAGFTKQTGLPEFIIADTLPLDLGAVQAHFSDRIVGQESAVAAMVDLIAMVKAGLNDIAKPLGVYLFIGPTGVGKTQLAKTLAAYLFGDEQRMLRFDMSEYSDPAAIRRLIGVPGAGRDGAEGELTRRVRAQPFCVVLLDEFEKAHPNIFDLFLQVFDDGRLTDAQGNTVNFRNTIVIMTSNLASEWGNTGKVGFIESLESFSRSKVLTQMERFFKPEFINRIGRTVVFRPLGPETMRKIAERELNRALNRWGLIRRKMVADLDQSLVNLLVREGISARFGARPLKRKLEELILLPLARELLRAPVDEEGAILRLYARENRTLVRVVSTKQTWASPTWDGSDTPHARPAIDPRVELDQLRERLRHVSDQFEHDGMGERRRVQQQRAQAGDFFDDPAIAREILQEVRWIEHLDQQIKTLPDRLLKLRDRAKQPAPAGKGVERGAQGRLQERIDGLARDLRFLEFEWRCRDVASRAGAYVFLSGIEGSNLDEEDAVHRLASVYKRWAEQKHYDVEVLHERLNEREQVREVVLQIEGPCVAGLLAGEAGIHAFQVDGGTPGCCRCSSPPTATPCRCCRLLSRRKGPMTSPSRWPPGSARARSWPRLRRRRWSTRTMGTAGSMWRWFWIDLAA